MIRAICILTLIAMGGLGCNATKNQLNDADIKRTKIMMNSVKTALNQYKVNYGKYPEQATGLMALVFPPDGIDMSKKLKMYNLKADPPFIRVKKVPDDPWGTAIIYRSGIGKAPFTLVSKGPDGLLGTEDDIKVVGP